MPNGALTAETGWRCHSTGASSRPLTTRAAKRTREYCGAPTACIKRKDTYRLHGAHWEPSDIVLAVAGPDLHGAHWKPSDIVLAVAGPDFRKRHPQNPARPAVMIFFSYMSEGASTVINLKQRSDGVRLVL